MESYDLTKISATMRIGREDEGGGWLSCTFEISKANIYMTLERKKSQAAKWTLTVNFPTTSNYTNRS